jgi:hypothetical protein
MALISEWMQQCGKKQLDNAGIVRDAFLSLEAKRGTGPNEMPGEAASLSAPGRELICDFYEAPRCAGPVATDGPMVEGRWLSERRCPRERSSVP